EAAPRLNLTQLANRVAGKIDKLHDPSVTNLGRFIHSLDQDGNIETGVKIAPAVHELIGPVTINFSPPTMPMGQGGAVDFVNEADAIRKEEMEDRYFSGNPDGAQYENHETVDTSVWVPEGYVCIRVDARGVCKSPGLQAPFSVQEAEDYYDAIEWAGTQPWSNGNVGLWGMSYLAMAQHNVASLQPPH